MILGLQLRAAGIAGFACVAASRLATRPTHQEHVFVAHVKEPSVYVTSICVRGTHVDAGNRHVIAGCTRVCVCAANIHVCAGHTLLGAATRSQVGRGMQFVCETKMQKDFEPWKRWLLPCK